MKKKEYVAPILETDGMEQTGMLCGSQEVNSDLGIGYGGVDGVGEKAPDARWHSNLWDEE